MINHMFLPSLSPGTSPQWNVATQKCKQGEICSILSGWPVITEHPWPWGVIQKGYPLQYSGPENSMDCIVHRVAESRTRLTFIHTQGLEQQFSEVWLQPRASPANLLEAHTLRPHPWPIRYFQGGPSNLYLSPPPLQETVMHTQAWEPLG